MSMMAEEVQQHRGHRGRRHRGFAGGLFFAMETIFIALLAVTGISSCPRKCQCIWRDSKITVDCSDQELAAIPTTVEANTQVLNISGNNVPSFGRNHFARLGLTNLQRVSAERCSLVQIDGLAFIGLTNLVELDLSLNKLVEIPSDALNHAEGAAVSLMSLSLRANKIEAIRTRAFHGLQLLTKLDLSANRLEAVEAGAFEGLDNLQRLYLHSNRLTTLSARHLPASLHEISVHENRWTCDCRLRSFRLWLTQSNVPRMVEPSCQGPRRLLGIHVQSLSLAEFACAPQLSPTSMYLTVPKGKNVSIVCRVASDPVSTITWFFNGRQIHTSDHEESHLNHPRTSESLPPDYNLPHPQNPGTYSNQRQSRIRVIRHDDLVGSGETRSELLIQQTNIHDNGTYFCQAENKAARSVSNFTLHVTDGVDTPTILQLRLEYFIAVAVAVIVILIVVLIVVAVLLIRLCKSRLGRGSSSIHSDKITSINGSMTTLQSPYTGGTVVGNGKVAPLPSKMPKHIQMGTGFRMPPQQQQQQPQHSQQKPDLLSEAAHNLSRNSVNTTMTSTGKGDSTATSSNASHGSYKMAMENIIEDYHGGRKGPPPQSQMLPTASSEAVEATIAASNAATAGSSGGPPLIGQTYNSLLVSTSRTNTELPLLATLQPRRPPMEATTAAAFQDYPSDYGLPLHLGSLHGSLTRSGYAAPSSLQPHLYPLRPRGGHHMVMPDEQYPTMPFRSPYIHTADSGPSAIVYYPQQHQKSKNNSFSSEAKLSIGGGGPASTSTFQPIYESIGVSTTAKPTTTSSSQIIYSQVSKNKSGNEILRKTTPDINSEQASASGMLASSDLHHRGCDTDSAALERLSQLLTSSKDCSEVSVKNDLITLLDDQQMVIPSGNDWSKEAPMASAEDNSIGGSGSVQSEAEAKSETGTSTAIKTSIYQELDDAFTTLDQEAELENNQNYNFQSGAQQQPTMVATSMPYNSVGNAEGLVYSSPTSI